MKNKIKVLLVLSLMVLLGCSATSFAKQHDSYRVVDPKQGVSSVDAPVTQVADTTVATGGAISPTLTTDDILSTLQDVRCIMLGILFSTSFLAGGAVASAFQGGVNKC